VDALPVGEAAGVFVRPANRGQASAARPLWTTYNGQADVGLQVGALSVWKAARDGRVAATGGRTGCAIVAGTTGAKKALEDC
jgi:hypothetical protein